MSYHYHLTPKFALMLADSIRDGAKIAEELNKAMKDYDNLTNQLKKCRDSPKSKKVTEKGAKVTGKK